MRRWDTECPFGALAAFLLEVDARIALTQYRFFVRILYAPI
jgi:hypothetical protein